MESVLKRIAKSACFYFGNHVIAHVPFYWIRHCYYRNILRMRIGRGSAVHMGAFFVWNHITIGENSIINRQCYLDGRVGVEIGNNVSISPQVMVLSLTHDKNSPYFATIPGKVTIDRVTRDNFTGGDIGEGVRCSGRRSGYQGCGAILCYWRDPGKTYWHQKPQPGIYT